MRYSFQKSIIALLMLFHFVNIGTVLTVVALTAWIPEYRGLLVKSTRESGFFEIGSFIVLLLISAYAFYTAFSAGNKGISRKFSAFYICTAFLSLTGAMEEISWGQHLFSFQPPDFFIRHNRQGESNFHNLIPPEAFGFLSNSLVYAFFIFIPLFYHIYGKGRKSGNDGWLPRAFLPSLHNILMFCFAFSLQAYFRHETLADTAALCIALLVSVGLIFSRRQPEHLSVTVFHRFHAVLLILSTAFFMFHYRIFSYENVQYEIREFVICYAFLYWLCCVPVRKFRKSLPCQRAHLRIF